MAHYTTVTVKIRQKPIALIGAPNDGAQSATSTNLAMRGTCLDYDTAIANAGIYMPNGSIMGQYAPTNINYLSNPTNFFFNWNPAAASPQTWYALFTFNWTTQRARLLQDYRGGLRHYGYVSSSDSLTPLTVALTNSFTATNNLSASLDNLPMSTNAIGTISYTVISNGFFNLLGKARDPISTDALSYQLLLYLPATPGYPVCQRHARAPDAAGFHPGGDTTDGLGRLDLSPVQNGPMTSSSSSTAEAAKPPPRRDSPSTAN